ncbi:hypothetical protein [Castellaniella sp.]|uniref:hypothetical protein n=1 Tax=Castellaniella sp. TaxID=1955812 RepID=UPI00355CB82D
MNRHAQAGQALAEALLALGVLGSLWVAIGWLGQLQDIRQQLDHASRHAAFAFAHQGLAPASIEAQAQQDMAGPGHVWQTRDGLARISGTAALHLGQTGSPAPVQIGDPAAVAKALRRELHLGDEQPWAARISLATRGRPSVLGTLADFDLSGLRFQRHTAIARGSGAAQADAEVHEILAQSQAAWRTMADSSRTAGYAVAQRMAGVDQAWSRAQPEWDWLASWAGRLPARYLEVSP